MDIDIIIEGLARRCTKGQLFSCLLDQTPLKKHQVGQIEIEQGCAKVQLQFEDQSRADDVIKRNSILRLNDRELWLWSPSTPMPAHLQHHLDDLNSERQAQHEALEAELQSHAAKARLKGLKLTEQWEPWGQASRWTFETPQQLEERSWRAGTPVALCRGETHHRAVVHAAKSNVLELSISQRQTSFPEQGSWTVVRVHTSLPMNRMCQATQRAGAMAWESQIEKKNINIPNGSQPEQASFRSSHLNSQQQLAAQQALSSAPISLIHGPPGTGKTTVLLEVIQELVRRKQRVLVCAASHSAVDHLGERCLARGLDVLRLGHSPKISEALTDHRLNVKLKADRECQLAHKMLDEIPQLKAQARKADPRDRKALYHHIDEQRLEAFTILDRRRANLLHDAHLVLSTLSHLDVRRYGVLRFDVVICDEAGQSYEPEHWMVLPFAKRWILAGDPKQLPALTRKNTKQLHISLLERWMHEHPQDCTMLTTQYRMHPDIMAFPSETFYNGQLLADPSTRSQTHDFGEEQTWMFIDTAGAEAHEKTVDHSIQNMLEARWIVSKLTQWKTDGIDLSNIGVITPYDAQKRLIKQLMSKNGFNEHDRECIEIQSVDGFQGREKKVILISFVRCNEDGELGFVDDPQRLNVALTRAQQHLICIGDSITLSHSKYLSELMAHSETSGNYRSWFEMEPQ